MMKFLVGGYENNPEIEVVKKLAEAYKSQDLNMFKSILAEREIMLKNTMGSQVGHARCWRFQRRLDSRAI
ncbi:hypothetical protein AYI69_g3205 [Smittium culicis]|uniref:Uncharacterized protein n=1 Tax=Smittium culicis TaxID=133412 RepID=A0A1R1YKF5_9FUNG|nr:hypothetical protein AYI69_g3205 [Smittium culicis]